MQTINDIKKNGIWSRQQRRAYQRILSGVKYHHSKGDILRFMTLTSSPEAVNDISYDFKRLKQWIRRRFPEFEYIAIKTSEGNGVIHILFVGCYIPQRMLSNIWASIHHSPIVDIRMVHANNGLVRYVVSQYCAGQSKFERYYWSWGWVQKGFVKIWRMIVYMFGYRKGISIWDKLMSLKPFYYDYEFVIKPPPNIGVYMLFQVSIDGEPEKRAVDTADSKFYKELLAKMDWVNE